MKKVIQLLAMVACCHVSEAQTKRPTLQLTYEYENAANGEKRTVTLLYNNQESLTRFSTKDTTMAGTEPKDFDISGEDAEGRQVYKNTMKGEVIFRDFLPQGSKFIPCIVVDPMKPMPWSFMSETRKIGKYNCKGASTEFRGRKYIAWYAEDIPVTHGPWKFSGLPGAIIDVHTIDRSHSFTLIKIATVQVGEIKRPGDAQSFTMIEYVKQKEQAVTDFINRLTAALPRGAEITSVNVGDNNLETNFSDVKK